MAGAIGRQVGGYNRETGQNVDGNARDITNVILGTSGTCRTMGKDNTRTLNTIQEDWGQIKGTVSRDFLYPVFSSISSFWSY